MQLDAITANLKKGPPVRPDPAGRDQVTADGGADAPMADSGRNGDTMMAHVTPGEIVIPITAQTPELLSVLTREFQRTGTPLTRYIVGNEDNSINPDTGEQEHFSLGKIFSKILPIVGTVASAATGNPLFAMAGNAIGSAAGGSSDSGSSAPAVGATAGATNSSPTANLPSPTSASINYEGQKKEPISHIDLSSVFGSPQTSGGTSGSGGSNNWDETPSSSTLDLQSTGTPSVYNQILSLLKNGQSQASSPFALGKPEFFDINSPAADQQQPMAMETASTSRVNPASGKQEFAALPYGMDQFQNTSGGYRPTAYTNQAGGYRPTANATPTPTPAPSLAPVQTKTYVDPKPVSTSYSSPTVAATSPSSPPPTIKPITLTGNAANDQAAERGQGYLGTFSPKADGTYAYSDYISGKADAYGNPIGAAAPAPTPAPAPAPAPAPPAAAPTLHYGVNTVADAIGNKLGYYGPTGGGGRQAWLAANPDLAKQFNAQLLQYGGDRTLTDSDRQALGLSNPTQDAANSGQNAWLTELNNRLQSLIDQQNATTTTAATTPAATTTPSASSEEPVITRVSSLSPDRSLRFGSRRNKGNLARNF